MKIRCITNDGNSLPAHYLSEGSLYRAHTPYNVTSGYEYVVYAIRFSMNQIQYFICDDVYSNYPMHYPAPLFEVVDRRFSKYWQFSPLSFDDPGEIIIAAPEWADDRFFFVKVVDEEMDELKTWHIMKRMIDAEYRKGASNL